MRSRKTKEEVKKTFKKEEAAPKKEGDKQTETTKVSVLPEKEEVHISEIKVEEKSSLIVRTFIPFTIGMVVGLLIGGGFLVYYSKGSFNVAQKPSPTPTILISPTKIQEKIATESGTLDKDLTLYDIKVLNGSGKGGEAARVEKILKNAGFAVLEIGNADRIDYKKTVIKAKTKVPEDFIKKLKGVLEELFELDNLETLSETEKTEVVIIVGSSPKKEATPSAMPTTSPSPTTKP